MSHLRLNPSFRSVSDASPLTPLTPLSPNITVPAESPDINPYSSKQSKEAIEEAELVLKKIKSPALFSKECNVVLFRGSDNIKPEHVKEWKQKMEVVTLLEGKYLKADMPVEIFGHMDNLRMKLLFCIFNPPKEFKVDRSLLKKDQVSAADTK